MRTTTAIISLIGALLMAPAGTSAQAPAIELSLTGQPHSWDIEGKPYQVTGYGNARLGMSVEDVRRVIGKDYPSAVAALKDEVDPATHARGLTLVVPRLAPGPGPATISYVFGASGKRLVAVNVYWLLASNTDPAQQASLVAAAGTLASGFAGWQWPVLSTARGHVIGRNTLVVFSGKDEAGGGVEIRLDGVAFAVEQRQRAGAPARPPEQRSAPPGPAQLRLSFVASVDKPDIYRIPAGAF